MAGTSVLVDTSFLIALLRRGDAHHTWAVDQALSFVPPWQTCEPVLAETFYQLGHGRAAALATMLRRGALLTSFYFDREQETVLTLMQKYADVPMSLADACLVRMTEIHPDPILLTADADFRIYRRHSRQVVPCVMPE